MFGNPNRERATVKGCAQIRQIRITRQGEAGHKLSCLAAGASAGVVAGGRWGGRWGGGIRAKAPLHRVIVARRLLAADQQALSTRKDRYLFGIKARKLDLEAIATAFVADVQRGGKAGQQRVVGAVVGGWLAQARQPSANPARNGLERRFRADLGRHSCVVNGSGAGEARMSELGIWRAGLALPGKSSQAKSSQGESSKRVSLPGKQRHDEAPKRPTPCGRESGVRAEASGRGGSGSRKHGRRSKADQGQRSDRTPWAGLSSPLPDTTQQALSGLAESERVFRTRSDIALRR